MFKKMWIATQAFGGVFTDRSSLPPKKSPAAKAQHNLTALNLALGLAVIIMVLLKPARPRFALTSVWSYKIGFRYPAFSPKWFQESPC
jgi:hypothetical protein